MDTRPQNAPVAAEIQRLKARITELDTQLLAAQLENEDLRQLLTAARANCEREQDDHQAYRAEHPDAAVQVVLPPAGWVDRLTGYLVFHLTRRQLLTAVAATPALLWGGHQLWNWGNR